MRDKEKAVSLVSLKPLEELTYVEFDVATYNENGGKITVIVPGDVSGKALAEIGAIAP